MKKNVLVLTDTTSKSTGASIKEYAKGQNEELNFIIIGRYELVGSVRYFISERFLDGAEMIKKLYSRYDASKMDELLPETLERRNGVGVLYAKIEEAIRKYSPVAVLILTPQLVEPVLIVRDEMQRNFKVICIVDEFVLDKRVIHKSVDFYIVDNADEREVLIQHGIPEDRTEIAAIPVRSSYKEVEDKAYCAKALRLPNKKTLLFVSGMSGEERFKKILSPLAERKLDINVIVACGYNRRLLEYVREYTDFSYWNEGLDLNIPYEFADLIIAKPTAIVLAESFYKEKPIITAFPEGEMEKRAQGYLNGKYIKTFDTPVAMVDAIDAFFKGELSFDKEINNMKERKCGYSEQIMLERIKSLVLD